MKNVKTTLADNEEYKKTHLPIMKNVKTHLPITKYVTERTD
jgi:hypothetical protein